MIRAGKSKKAGRGRGKTAIKRMSLNVVDNSSKANIIGKSQNEDVGLNFNFLPKITLTKTKEKELKSKQKSREARRRQRAKLRRKQSQASSLGELSGKDLQQNRYNNKVNTPESHLPNTVSNNYRAKLVQRLSQNHTNDTLDDVDNNIELEKSVGSTPDQWNLLEKTDPAVSARTMQDTRQKQTGKGMTDLLNKTKKTFGGVLVHYQQRFVNGKKVGLATEDDLEGGRKSRGLKSGSRENLSSQLTNPMYKNYIYSTYINKENQESESLSHEVFQRKNKSKEDLQLTNQIDLVVENDQSMQDKFKDLEEWNNHIAANHEGNTRKSSVCNDAAYLEQSSQDSTSELQQRKSQSSHSTPLLKNLLFRKSFELIDLDNSFHPDLTYSEVTQKLSERNENKEKTKLKTPSAAKLTKLKSNSDEFKFFDLKLEEIPGDSFEEHISKASEFKNSFYQALAEPNSWPYKSVQESKVDASLVELDIDNDSLYSGLINEQTLDSDHIQNNSHNKFSASSLDCNLMKYLEDKLRDAEELKAERKMIVRSSTGRSQSRSKSRNRINLRESFNLLLGKSSSKSSTKELKKISLISALTESTLSSESDKDFKLRSKMSKFMTEENFNDATTSEKQNHMVTLSKRFEIKGNKSAKATQKLRIPRATNKLKKADIVLCAECRREMSENENFDSVCLKCYRKKFGIKGLREKQQLMREQSSAATKDNLSPKFDRSSLTSIESEPDFGFQIDL